jgi:hypothetical protein
MHDDVILIITLEVVGHHNMVLMLLDKQTFAKVISRIITLKCPFISGFVLNYT